MAVLYTELGDVFTKITTGASGAVNKGDQHRTARDGFEADRPAAGTEVEHTCCLNAPREGFEQDLAKFASGMIRTRRDGVLQKPTTKLTVGYLCVGGYFY